MLISFASLQNIKKEGKIGFDESVNFFQVQPFLPF
jgi:hypothetical protein